MSASLATTLAGLKPIPLLEMDKVALMNRVDTKFIFHKDLLSTILVDLADFYNVLAIDGQRIFGYKNLYFDTQNFKFYNDHHNGKANRSKVRIREYENTGVCYIEVKRKNNQGRTNKTRRRIDSFESNLSIECSNFINNVAPYDLNNVAVLYNQFKRLTLVNNVKKERLTFDFGLSFKSDEGALQYDNLVIAEVKQGKLSRSSEIFKCLKSQHINPFRISKYCVGMSSLKQGIKHNAFKEKIRRINKINNS